MSSIPPRSCIIGSSGIVGFISMFGGMFRISSYTFHRLEPQNYPKFSIGIQKIICPKKRKRKKNREGGKTDNYATIIRETLAVFFFLSFFCVCSWWEKSPKLMSFLCSISKAWNTNVIYQKVLRGEVRMAKVMLIRSGLRKEEASHVDRQEIGAVTTSDRDRLEQAATRNAHLQHRTSQPPSQTHHNKKKNNPITERGGRKRREDRRTRTRTGAA